MSLRAAWSRNRTFLIVVVALLAFLLLTTILFSAFGTGESGVEIGPIETTR